ncbi:MAG: DUF255 domain-containing protein [Limisphaerales bacterium]
MSVFILCVAWMFQTSVAFGQNENLGPELFRRTVPTNDPSEHNLSLAVYGPNAAQSALEAACEQAANESKAVFIKSGHPECGWCRVFDRYHSSPEVQRILGKYYIIVAIDIKYMPDGKSTFSKYAQPGSPSWVIVSPQKQLIVDSYAPGGNVGYPGSPEEAAYYIAALKKATPSITEEELHTLSQLVQKPWITWKKGLKAHNR